MTDSKDLIERLRVEADWCDCIEEICPHTAAADHIEKLEADNARLREALEEWMFRYYWRVDGMNIEQARIHARIHARAALQEKSHD